MQSPTYPKNTTLTIEEMRGIAASRGGSCLSTTYVNNKTLLCWKCSVSTHSPWWASPGNVKNHGSWCPECIINVGEEITRATLEEAFPGHRFIRTRNVPWLGKLELDGYCESKQLAFEYQGIQHDKEIAFFHKTETAFSSQVERDKFKQEQCELNNVMLICVSHTVPYTKLRTFIRQQLIDEYGYIEEDLAPVIMNDTEFFDQIRSSSTRSATQLEKAKEIIERKGGVCISTLYVGYRVPLTIRCEKGHVFQSTLESISRDDVGPRFCIVCASTQPITEKQCEQFAIQRGYKYLGRDRCLDMTNPNKSRWRLALECKKGHLWFPTWDNLRAGKNCKECAIANLPGASARRLTDICVNARVFGRGLILLDPEYRNNSTIHTWRCNAGHVFQDAYNTIEGRSADTACMICEFNAHGAIFGLELMQQSVYGPRLKSKWPWQCILCLAQNIGATKTGVTVDNFKKRHEKGEVLLGRSKAHLCQNAPPQPERIITRVRKAPRQIGPKAAALSTWEKTKGLTLVSPSFTKPEDKTLQWKCDRNQHIFENSHAAISKRLKPCTVCEYNDEGAHYGWRIQPQELYCVDKTLWPRECLLCKQQGIIALHTNMKANNHIPNEKRRICSFGRAISHKCPLPRGRPNAAPYLWLIVGRAHGLPDNAVRYTVWFLLSFFLG